MIPMQSKSNLILLKEDYDQLKKYAQSTKDLLKLDKVNAAGIMETLQEAEVLDKEQFPWDVVRLYSKVTLKSKEASYSYTYTVVLPEEADHRKAKVSVLSPIGASMYGFRKGAEVFWQGPNGKRMFTIVSVIQNNK